MKKCANFQGDMLSFCGTITIFVLTTNHLLKVTIHSELNLVRNSVENIYTDENTCPNLHLSIQLFQLYEIRNGKQCQH